MIKTQFTPGEWHGDGREAETGDILVYAPEAKHGCRDICFIPEDDEQDRANANLIAAAPELFRCLQEALPYVDECFGDLDRSLSARIDAALAKARGEQSPLSGEDE